MNAQTKTGQDGCNRDLTLTPQTEQSAKEACASLSDYVAVIHAQKQAEIVFDLIRHGQQHPDYLHEQIMSQTHQRAFVAQVQKRIVGGGK
jgi:fructose 1,6-bisphosphatase